jgi:ABC-type transport system substrate-binding protein
LDAWDLSHEEYGRLLEWKQPKDDAVKESMSLLSAAGFTRNSPLRFEFTGTAGNVGQSEPAATLLQAQWTRLGQGVVDARIKLLEGPAYQSARATRDYTYGLFSNAAAVNEPDLYLNQIYRSNANRNYWNWEDPTLDQMIDKQHAIFDIPQRKAIIRDILVYLVDRHPGTICSYLYFLSGQTSRVQDMATEYFLIGRQWEHVWLDT